MDVTQTSLEALLLKATNPQNLNIDTAAVEAFIALIHKEKDGIYIGVKVLSNRLPTGNEIETLQTLQIIDICMNRCGQQFQSEIGKFRFLNEMIKLVSPKYLGSRTPLTVKQKVLQLLYLWTIDYPKETKIKEAYDMLKKQGVIRELPNLQQSQITTTVTTKNKRPMTNSLLQDEEKSKVLQKLLQSKDPEDIQAANWLIKSMVKEDDKRAELKSKYTTELESAQNNVRLLNEMLDTYKTNTASIDEVDLIKELHQSCERLRPNIMKLATETLQGEEILRDALQINDELGHVFTKFARIFGKNQPEPITNNSSLLQFDISPRPSTTTTIIDKKLPDNSNNDNNNHHQHYNNNDKDSDIDVLCDIFSASEITDCSNILQPTQLQQSSTNRNVENSSTNSKINCLEDLDVLSEHLFKQNLISTKQNSFKKNSDKVPMNLLTRTTNPQKSLDDKQQQQKLQLDSLDFDLNCLLNKHKEEPNSTQSISNNDKKLIDISDEQLLEANSDDNDDYGQNLKSNHNNTNNNIDEIPIRLSRLNDINIDITDIKPSHIPPLVLFDEPDGVNVTLHFAKDKPKDDIQVFVVTTINKKQLPLENYMFQAIIPKECKLKLQQPSSTVLPAYNPFLPPSAITQVMLIASPTNVNVFFKYVFSYGMGDETFTEMGQIESLQLY